MSDNNRFKDVINAARHQPQQEERTIAANPPQPQRPEPAKRGRPTGGKRGNAEYVQVSTFVRKELYKQVRIRLMQMEPEGQFSDLVDHLLTRWIQQNPRQ